MKTLLLSVLCVLAFTLTKAQQSCTIQANCKQVLSLSASARDSILIYGLVAASDGVKSYIWKQTSGPNGAILSTPAASSTYVKSLVPGTYIFGFSAITNTGTLLAPIPDTLQVLPFIDGIDSVRIYYRSGKIIKQ